VDNALRIGQIDRSLPFVKKRSVELLTATYPSTEAGRQAMHGLEAFYEQSYPEIAETRRREIEKAVETLSDIYVKVAAPEMDVDYSQYPSFLGHRETQGCFRCHDGRHVLLDEQGRPTRNAIASSCATCHTVPQLGDLSMFEPILGQPPANHRKDMLVNHVAVIREGGGSTSSCALCHQPPACARCHQRENVLVAAAQGAPNSAQDRTPAVAQPPLARRSDSWLAGGG
jgi:hypothetical protein